MKRIQPRQHGFTLVELVLVVMITGILAAALAVFLRPAVDTWLAMRTRTDLSYQTASALRRMRDEVRLAVPNSIRTPGSQCIELVPTLTGARVRREADTTTTGSAPLDTSAATSQFDLLSPLSTLPGIGDWVVVDNQNPGDVYSTGVNKAQITGIAATPFGAHRISIAPTQFPTGYAGHRMVVVANAVQSVFYVCEGANGGLNSSGDGNGVLARVVRGFNATYPTTCPAASGGTLLATGVRSCRFIYDPAQGATQQSGFVSMQIELARSSESATLVVGAHVANVP